MDKEKKKIQTMRYSDEELKLIKSVFTENDSLLRLMRKAFFQFPISTEEIEILSKQFDSELIKKIMRKTFLPEIDNDIPVGQSIDLLMTVEMRDKDPNRVMVDLMVRQKLIEKIEVGLVCLTGAKPVNFEEVIDFKLNLNTDILLEFVRLNARNTYISHIEQQLVQLKILAGLKSESEEEIKKNQEKDSTQ